MEIEVIPAKYVVSGFEFDTEQEAQDWIDSFNKGKFEQQIGKLKDGYLYVVDLLGECVGYYTVIGTKRDIQKTINNEDIHIRAVVDIGSIMEHKPDKTDGEVVFGEDFIGILERGLR